jgi:predicted MPP superfamily phosphohydrolase
LFLLTVIGILGTVYGYTGWRLISSLFPDSITAVIAWSVVVVLGAMPVSFLWLRSRAVESDVADAYAWITYLSMGYVVITFGLLLCRDVCWVGLDLISWAFSQLSADVEAMPLLSVDATASRSILLLTNLGIMVIAFLMSFFGLYQARRRPAVARVSVPIADLPADLEGLTIGQISDVHAGTTIKKPMVERIVEALAACHPDLIAVTGDLVDQSVARLQSQVAPLAGLRAPLGSFFVTGNHEYYAGAPAWIEELETLGFRVLVNEHVLIERGSARLLLAGVTDLSAGESLPGHASDVSKAMANAPAADVRILLAHQPGTIQAAAAAGFHLQLSGHTHGGQFPPWKYIVRLQQPFTAGLHRNENTWIYVSRGAGYWGPPIRLGAPSEVTLLTLLRA